MAGYWEFPACPDSPFWIARGSRAVRATFELRELSDRGGALGRSRRMTTTWALLIAGQGCRNKHGTLQRIGPVAITKLPGIVACTGAVVMASENSNPEAILTLKLTTKSGDLVLLPLSERTTRQLQLVISEFNRTRDLLFVEERPSASATLQ
jgi:hypothetical protein